VLPGAYEVSDEGTAADSLEVQKSGSVFDRLPPACIFYIILIWLLVAGVGVVIERFKLPPMLSNNSRPIPATRASRLI
jgi:hypothetical protein